jgi:GT2 family glycosyltransferase
VKVSVCVPTYRRPGPLAEALDALLALDPPDGGYEVVVVDDGSPVEDGVGAVLEAAAAGAPVPLRWERLPANAGPAAARNAAWRVAAGEWLAFTDDDCRPARDWLVRLLDRADAAGADVVQGRTRPDPDKAHLLAEPWARSMVVDEQNEYFQTCNILYRRALVADLGGFDERFRAIGDDTDLGWRALAAGARVVFAGDAVVDHDVVVKDFAADLRSRRRWVDTIRVLTKHPDARRLAWKPYIYRRSHVPLLGLLLVSPVIVTRRGRQVWFGLVAALAACDAARAGSPQAAAVAVQRRIADAYEIALLAAASARYRVLLL